ncbi:tetratricopeptide repeat protein [Pectobacterium carotovorum]
MQYSKKIVSLVISAFLLSGCVMSTPKSSDKVVSQEDILLKTKNYNGLINLYRNWMKVNDNYDTRLKLSNYYYLAGDYKSSLYYLQALNAKPDMKVYMLQAKNMIALGDYGPAVRVTDKMLQNTPQSAEAYNLRGVALALSGKLNEGQQAIDKSRALFIEDDVALNNLAMIAMMDGRYQDSVGLLLPQYLRGRKAEKMLRNLVVSLVKVGDRRYARTIIENENLSRNPDELIDALAGIRLSKGGVNAS